MKKTIYKNILAALVLAVFCGGAVTYAQFARQTGETGWGYGFGFGFGYGYGWDSGSSAGYRTDTEDEWTLYDTANSDIATNNITFIADNPNGSDVYMSDNYTTGLIHFDGSTWSQYTTSNSNIPDNIIRLFDVDINGTVWMTSSGGGLTKFDGATFTRYTTLDGLPTNTLANVETDNSGNVWITTSTNGVVKFDGATFTNYTTSDGLPTNSTTTVTIDTNNNVWVGTANSGTAKFDGATWTTYNTTSNPSDIPSNAMQLVSAGPDGEVWFGMGGLGGGILKFDGSSTWTHYTSSDTDLLAVDSGMIADIFADSNGNLWFKMGSVNGPMKFDGSTWTHYDEGSDIPNASTYRTSEINGNIWFTSSDSKGAIKLDPRNDPAQYGYGYGWGFLIGHSDQWTEPSWDAGSQTYEISEEYLPSFLFTNAGIVVPDSYDSTWVGSVTFNFAVNVEADNNSISISDGTVMTTEDDSLADFTQFGYEEILEEGVEVPDGQEFIQAFSLGLPSIGLNVDPAITIMVAVGDDYNDQTLNIYHMSPTEDEWTLIATCEVSLGDCSFETTALSSFLVTADVPEEEEEEDGGGGGGGIVPLPYLFSNSQTNNNGSIADEDSGGQGGVQKFKFLKNLHRGMFDSDVRELQKFLNTHGFPLAKSGFGSPGSETVFFGARTQKALQAYQKANGITPSAGYFGLKTRRSVNNQN